ncbi:MAG TPA: hypothetical protein PKJ41_20660, partial [Bryobacteraceae bacterium]|nr:hypothetical protein [Bryobacteraceae bacterium]
AFADGEVFDARDGVAEGFGHGETYERPSVAVPEVRARRSSAELRTRTMDSGVGRLCPVDCCRRAPEAWLCGAA